MTAPTIAPPTIESVETRLREELVQGDEMLSSVAPALRHLLASEDRALLNDDAVAHVRGMLTDVARQLLHAQAEAGRISDPASFVTESVDDLTRRLADEPAILAHVHALTVEAGLALRLQRDCDLDPVLCPLLQDLVASSDDGMAGTAMAVLTAQARFVQQYRRMSLPLGELPGDLLHLALLILRAAAGDREMAAVAAERAVRDEFDEGRGRLALITRLAVQMDRTAPRALDIGEAGLAIFTTALAMKSAQRRETTVLSFASRHGARLVLTMLAAGLDQPVIEEQLLYLRPGFVRPDGIRGVSAERAAMLLAGGRTDG